MLVRDAIEQPVRHADDQHRLAAAAAHRNAGIECVIETPDAESDTREPCLVVADHAANRMGRVARRVAERYPNALQLC